MKANRLFETIDDPKSSRQNLHLGSVHRRNHQIFGA